MFGDLRGILDDLKSRISRGEMSSSVEVLMFHDIGEVKDYGPQKYSVTEDHFERVISSYADTREFVSLDDVVSWLNGTKELPENAVAVTFDDGYLSTNEKALPILEKFDAPATVYVPSNFLDAGSMYGFRLVDFLEKNEKIDFEFNDENFSFNLESLEGRKQAYNEIKGVLRNLTVSKRQDVMDGIGAGRPSPGRLMDKKDLRELDESDLISIGAHGTDHRRLTDLNLKDAEKSIVESKSSLEEVLGHDISSFSFPFGSKNEQVVHKVEEAGFENAVVTEGRKISERDWGRVYRIPRIDGKEV